MKNTEFTIWQYAKKLIIWRFTRKKYLNRKFRFQHKNRKVIAEKFLFVFLDGINNPIPKTFIDTISFKKPENAK